MQQSPKLSGSLVPRQRDDEDWGIVAENDKLLPRSLDVAPELELEQRMSIKGTAIEHEPYGRSQFESIATPLAMKDKFVAPHAGVPLVAPGGEGPFAGATGCNAASRTKQHGDPEVLAITAPLCMLAFDVQRARLKTHQRVIVRVRRWRHVWGL